MPEKTLIYCTSGYPGDVYSERSFVTPELLALRHHFDRIILVPLDFLGVSLNFHKTLPKGISVDWSLARDKFTHSRLLKSLLIFHPYVLKTLWHMRGEARDTRQWAKGFLQAANTVTISRSLKKILKRHNLNPQNTVLYSFWFHDSGAAIARLAEKNGWKSATRAHTSDIYDELMVFRSRIARERHINSLQKIITISENGKNYLEEAFPHHSAKFRTILLGSSRSQTPGFYKPSDGITESLNIWTVARLDPLKRINLIIDILENIASLNPSRKICLTVIGDGECLTALKERVRNILAPNFKVNIEGMLDNLEIQKRYSENPPQWFMMASTTEGIPIAMGEAMSYGVPVISTDVGQISELADTDNSILLDRNPMVEDAATILSEKIFDTVIQKSMSANALKKWGKCFNSDFQSSITAAELSAILG